MGTRSITRVFDGKDEVLAMYRQMDGHPSGHGTELAKLLSGVSMVNGIGLTEGRRIANGPGCLAAQIVAHFKDGPGGIYLVKPKSKEHWQEYEYHIHGEMAYPLTVSCYSTSGSKGARLKSLLLNVSVEQFLQFCRREV